MGIITTDSTINTLIYKVTKGVILHPVNRIGVKTEPQAENEVWRGIHGMQGIIEYFRNEAFMWQGREKTHESIELYFMCGAGALMMIQEYLHSLEGRSGLFMRPLSEYLNCYIEPYGKVHFVHVPDFDSSLLTGHRHIGLPLSSYKIICTSQLGYYQFELDQKIYLQKKQENAQA